MPLLNHIIFPIVISQVFVYPELKLVIRKLDAAEGSHACIAILAMCMFHADRQRTVRIEVRINTSLPCLLLVPTHVTEDAPQFFFVVF